LALSREQKVERVKQYADLLEQSRGIILVDYRGLTVGELQTIRGRMRPVSSQFQVVKNRLLELALEEKNMSLPDDWLTGPTAVSFCERRGRWTSKAGGWVRRCSPRPKSGASQTCRHARCYWRRPWEPSMGRAASSQALWPAASARFSTCCRRTQTSCRKRAAERCKRPPSLPDSAHPGDPVPGGYVRRARRRPEREG